MAVGAGTGTQSLVIEVSNEAVLKALERLPRDVEGHIARANLATGRAIARGAQARVSVRYGFLRDSIGIKVSKQGDVYVGIDRAKKFAIPGTRRFSGRSSMAMPSKYAHLVERGTNRSDAKPFLWPAVNAEEGVHMVRLRDAVQLAIDEAGLGD